MMNKTELNMKEMETVVGGFVEGNTYTVSGTKNFLAIRFDNIYDDVNIIDKVHNGDKLKVVGPEKGSYVLVENPKTGKTGYVNKRFLK